MQGDKTQITRQNIILPQNDLIYVTEFEINLPPNQSFIDQVDLEMSTLSISAEDALDIADSIAGMEYRQQVNYECEITVLFVFQSEIWQVIYSNGPQLFVNALTGDAEVIE